MRKLMFAALLGASLAAMISKASAQGHVTFQIGPSQMPITFGADPNAGQRVFGPFGTYMYGLYVGPIGSTSLSQLTLIDTAPNPNSISGTSFAAGLFSGGIVSGQGNAGAANGFPGLVAGTTYSDEVAAWPAADGPDYLTALKNDNGTGNFGLSGIGFITASAPQDSPPSVFILSGPGNAPGQLPGFSIAPVPVSDVSSTFGLMSLAIGALAAVKSKQRLVSYN